jgi:hypothetical protein
LDIFKDIVMDQYFGVALEFCPNDGYVVKHECADKTLQNKQRCVNSGGMRWRSWLRHCATSRKVAGSLADGITGVFQ